MDYLFVYANGGWWLKLTSVAELNDYHKKTDDSRYEEAFLMYMHEGHPYEILERLELKDRLEKMKDPNFRKLQAAVIQAESGDGTIMDGFRWLNIEVGMKELNDLKSYGVVYINREGGSTYDLSYTQFCRRKELVFPDYSLGDIRVKQFGGGEHFYAYIGDMQVRDGDELKWNTYAEAYQHAERIVRGAEETL